MKYHNGAKPLEALRQVYGASGTYQLTMRVEHETMRELDELAQQLEVTRSHLGISIIKWYLARAKAKR